MQWVWVFLISACWTESVSWATSTNLSCLQNHILQAHKAWAGCIAVVLGQLQTCIYLMCSDPLCSLCVFSLHLVLSLPPVFILCAHDLITSFGYGSVTWAGIPPQISSRIWLLLPHIRILGKHYLYKHTHTHTHSPTNTYQDWIAG